MAFDLNAGGQGFTLDPSLWSFDQTASFETPRTDQTVPVSAVQSMQEVSEAPSAWGNFWQDTLKAGVGYLIAKDAAQSGVQPRPGQYPAGVYTQAPTMPGGGQAYRPTMQSNGLLFPLLIAGGLFLALKK